jgi:hypothetical protein
MLKLVISTTHVHAQPQASIQLSDTTLRRGTTVRLPIRAFLLQLPASFDSLRFIVRYAPSSLAFQRAVGAGASVMQCASPRVDSQFVNLNLGTVQVSCAALRQLPTNNDTLLTLATLEFLTLASPDVSTFISVESLFINGRVVALGSSRPAMISLQGAPLVSGEFPDALGQNYPNPGGAEGTIFPYTVADGGLVEFALISEHGVVVMDLPSQQRRQGRYLLNVQPVTTLSSGMYILRMTTPRGVYYRNFLLVK